MKKQHNHPHEYDFLRPLRERPDLDPDPTFINNLRQNMIQTKPRKRGNPFIPYLAASLAFMTFSILMVFYINDGTLRPKVGDETAEILDVEEINSILEFNYGTDDGEIGINTNTIGGADSGITSFFVRDHMFYILDNVNHKVIMADRDGHRSSFKVSENSSLKDIYVDEQKNIYLLDYANRVVYKYREDWQLEKSYPIPDSLKIPVRVTANEKKEIIVEQSQDNFINLETGKKASPKREISEGAFVKIVSDQLGRITVYDSGEKQDIDIEFEESFGEMTVHSINAKQIIFTKTEVAADITKIMAETHVYVMDKEGTVLGAVRVPLERMQAAPRHLVRVDQNEIYLLSPEENSLIVYELKPGKQFEKRLQDRIDEYKKDAKNEL